MIGNHSVRSYVAFQLLVAVIIVCLWLVEIIQAIFAGTTPPSIVEANLPVNVIYSLDLGVLVPAFVLSAYWLWERRAWGVCVYCSTFSENRDLGISRAGDDSVHDPRWAERCATAGGDLCHHQSLHSSW